MGLAAVVGLMIEKVREHDGEAVVMHDAAPIAEFQHFGKAFIGCIFDKTNKTFVFRGAGRPQARQIAIEFLVESDPARL